MSCGLRHFALRASSYQLWSGLLASAQPGRSQNFFRLLLAITLIDQQYLPFWEIHQGPHYPEVFASFAPIYGLTH
jgi:hypothetical protein